MIFASLCAYRIIFIATTIAMFMYVGRSGRQSDETDTEGHA